MENINSLVLSKQEIRGHQEVAYSLLSVEQPSFLSLSIKEEGQQLFINPIIPEGFYSWDNLFDMPVFERLRHMINVGRLHETLEETPFTFDFSPQNIIFSKDGIPYIINRGVVDQIPPYAKLSENEFLTIFKAMLVSVIDEQIDYESLVGGQLPFYKGDLFCEQVIEEEMLENLLLQLTVKQDSEEKHYREKFQSIKISLLNILKSVSLVATIVSAVALISLGYLLLVSLPKQELISSIRLSFINRDYSAVISSVKKIDSKSLSKDDKYIVASSVVLTEPLTDEQKEALNQMSIKSNEEYLRYWVLIGQAKLDEAIDVASFLDDPQLLMYSLTKKIDEVQRNPDLTSDERTEQLATYKSTLEELKKEYFPDEESIDLTGGAENQSSEKSNTEKKEQSDNSEKED